MQIITVHGRKFGFDCQGFGRHEADKDRGVNVALDVLRAASPEAISQAHADELAFERGDRPERAELVQEAESAGDVASTEGWHNPNAASITIVAVE